MRLLQALSPEAKESFIKRALKRQEARQKKYVLSVNHFCNLFGGVCTFPFPLSVTRCILYWTFVYHHCVFLGWIKWQVKLPPRFVRVRDARAVTTQTWKNSLRIWRWLWMIITDIAICGMPYLPQFKNAFIFEYIFICDNITTYISFEMILIFTSSYCFFSHRRWMTIWMHKWSKYRIICSQQEFCPLQRYMQIGTVGIKAYRNITLLDDPVQYKLHARAKGCMYDVHCTWSKSITNSHNSRKLQNDIYDEFPTLAVVGSVYISNQWPRLFIYSVVAVL